MRCPECKAPSRCTDTRRRKQHVKRRYECANPKCSSHGRRFTTIATEVDGETVESVVVLAYVTLNGRVVLHTSA